MADKMNKIKFLSNLKVPHIDTDNMVVHGDLTVKGTTITENQTSNVIEGAITIYNLDGNWIDTTLMGQVILTGRYTGSYDRVTFGDLPIEDFPDKDVTVDVDISSEFGDYPQIIKKIRWDYANTRLYYVDSQGNEFIAYEKYPDGYSWFEFPGTVAICDHVQNFQYYNANKETADWLKKLVVSHDCWYFDGQVAYGILYDPGTQSIRLGEGNYGKRDIYSVEMESSPNSFEFNEGEGEPIAVRDLHTEDDGSLVMWDAEKYCLVKAPIKMGVGKDSLQIGDGTANGAYSIAGGTADKSVIENLIGSTAAALIKTSAPIADADMSLAFGTNSKAVSAGSLCIGVSDTVGVTGYYWDSITFGETEDTITLSSTRRGSKHNNPTYPSSTDWEAGDIISIVNDDRYTACAKINSVNGNTITVTKLPFTKVNYEALPIIGTFVYSLPDDRTIYAVNAKNFDGTDSDASFLDKLSGDSNYIPRTGPVELGFAAQAIGAMNTSTGILALATGYNNWTAAPFAHAEGSENMSLGYAAHVEGARNKASGAASHAEGADNIASANHAHAEGKKTQSVGYSAHAEGQETIVSGENAHGEGFSVKVESNNAHGEGYKVSVRGERAHGEGSQTTAYGLASHSEGTSSKIATDILTTDELSNGNFTTIANKWNDSGFALAYGQGSHIEGNNNFAYGKNSHAEGNKTIAYGESSHSEGFDNIASGLAAHAEGYNNNALGKASHAEGMDNVMTGYEIMACHIEGASNTIDGRESEMTSMIMHAEGEGNTIIESNAAHIEGSGNTIYEWSTGAHVEGQNNTIQANSSSSHAEGFNNTIYGKQSHAEGWLNVVKAPYSHAEGRKTLILSECGHTENSMVTSAGVAAHAEGTSSKMATDVTTEAVLGGTDTEAIITAWSTARNFNLAKGQGSHTQNNNNLAIGKNSSVAGDRNIATGEAQFVVGKYNKRNDSALFIVGNGASASAPSNVFEVTTNAAFVRGAQVATLDDIPNRSNYQQITEDTSNKSLTFSADKYIIKNPNTGKTKTISSEELYYKNCSYSWSQDALIRNDDTGSIAPKGWYQVIAPASNGDISFTIKYIAGDVSTEDGDSKDSSNAVSTIFEVRNTTTGTYDRYRYVYEDYIMDNGIFLEQYTSDSWSRVYDFDMPYWAKGGQAIYLKSL